MGCCASKNPQVVQNQTRRVNLDTQEDQLTQLKRLVLYRKAKCAPMLDLKSNKLLQRRKAEVSVKCNEDFTECHTSERFLSCRDS